MLNCVWYTVASVFLAYVLFFFKQKTAYELRISDWSSDVCSSDLLPIVGLNYKDAPKDAIAWLKRHGNAYETSVSDEQGLAGNDYGVYGVPETYVIDKTGVIRYKHIGAVSYGEARDTILPLVRELQQ